MWVVLTCCSDYIKCLSFLPRQLLLHLLHPLIEQCRRCNALTAKALDTRLESLALAAKDSREANNETRNEVGDCQASLSQDVKTSSETTSLAIQRLQTSVVCLFRGLTGTLGDLKDVIVKS